MSPFDKTLVWVHGEVTTPPVSVGARREVGYLLRLLQQGERLAMPQSRPMPIIGVHCHELRVNAGDVTWRIIYRVGPIEILVLDVFKKKTAGTPRAVIVSCIRRLRRYEATGQAE